MLHAALKAELGQQIDRHRHRFRAATAGDKLRHHHVLKRRKLRQQVMLLINETDLRPAQGRAFSVIERADIAAADGDRAGRRPLQQPADLQQGRLASPRGPDQRHHLPRLNTQLHALEHAQPATRLRISTRDIDDIERGGVESAHRLLLTRCVAALRRALAPDARAFHRAGGSIHSAAPPQDRAGPPARPGRSSRGTRLQARRSPSGSRLPAADAPGVN